MTANDVATLLVAILGSNQTVDAAKTIYRYRKAKAVIKPGIITEAIYHGVQIADLIELSPDHHFIDAVAAVIGAAEKGMLIPGLNPESTIDNALTITAQSPWTVGEISIRPTPRAYVTVRYGLKELDAKITAGLRKGDLTEYRRISANTFVYLGGALAGRLNELPPLEAA